MESLYYLRKDQIRNNQYTHSIGKQCLSIIYQKNLLDQSISGLVELVKLVEGSRIRQTIYYGRIAISTTIFQFYTVNYTLMQIASQIFNPMLLCFLLISLQTIASYARTLCNKCCLVITTHNRTHHWIKINQSFRNFRLR